MDNREKYNQRIKEEEIQGQIKRAKRKKEQQLKKIKFSNELEYLKEHSTGLINWKQKENSYIWDGFINEQKVFKINKGILKFSLSIYPGVKINDKKDKNLKTSFELNKLELMAESLAVKLLNLLKKQKNRYEFISLIKERKITENLFSSFNSPSERVENSHAMNSYIELGEGFGMSIQASFAHYCIPRKTFEDLSDYEKFEISITHEDEYIIVVNKFIRFFDYETRLEENEDEKHLSSLEYGAYVASGCSIAGFVRGETVDAIIHSLKSIILKIRSRNVLIEKQQFKTRKFYKLN